MIFFRPIFLQKRTHRAGAQTCLARLLKQKKMLAVEPVLIMEESNGWLWHEAGRIGITRIAVKFPSSRSLMGRISGNRKFAKQVEKKLPRTDKQWIVQGNDHLEALLSLALAKKIGATKALFLRSPNMTESDYIKYRCDEFSLLSAVGDDFRDRVQSWSSCNKRIELLYDGIEEKEIYAPPQRSANCPTHWLVVGAALKWKGWRDLIDALVILEQRMILPDIQLDFTGQEPNQTENDLEVIRLKHVSCHFIGRVDGFSELVRRYGMVINPSRMETFGMAAIEVIAEGIPLFSTKTGIIDKVQHNDYLFSPSCPEEMAIVLENALQNWDKLDWNPKQAQQRIRDDFLVEKNTDQLLGYYQNIQASHPS